MPKRIYLIDLDGVVVQPGTHEFLNDKIASTLRDLSDKGDIWFFSSWAFTEQDITFLRSLGFPFGIIRKPTADEYIYIDDKLRIDLCQNRLK